MQKVVGTRIPEVEGDHLGILRRPGRWGVRRLTRGPAEARGRDLLRRTCAAPRSADRSPSAGCPEPAPRVPAPAPAAVAEARGMRRWRDTRAAHAGGVPGAGGPARAGPERERARGRPPRSTPHLPTLADPGDARP